MRYQNPTGDILTGAQIRALHPAISFGPDTFAELGWQPYTPPPPAPHVPDYRERRAMAYASLPEQLDMLFWDNTNGTTTWRDHIAAVKAAHPKPDEEQQS